MFSPLSLLRCVGWSAFPDLFFFCFLFFVFLLTLIGLPKKDMTWFVTVSGGLVSFDDFKMEDIALRIPLDVKYPRCLVSASLKYFRSARPMIFSFGNCIATPLGCAE